jgi:hypothetical protein
MAYVFTRTTARVPASLAEGGDGYALGPVLLGALLGAGLGVILAMLMGDGMRLAAQALSLSLPFGGWCVGALAGALGGGLLSAWIGGDMAESPDGHDEKNHGGPRFDDR